MLVGYARVSTTEQSLDSQLDALENAGCEKIFTDKASGIRDNRKGFGDLVAFIRPGDTLVTYRLDRLGRNLKNLIEIVEQFKERNIGLKFLADGIDTTTSGGTLIFNFFASIAQFEREIIVERTKIGLSAARARGRIGGRKPKLNDEKIKHAIELYQSEGKTVAEICRIIGISRCQLYEYLKKYCPNFSRRIITESTL